MKFFNATIERFQWLCDHKYYDFLPRAETEVPDYLTPYIEAECKHRGIFAVRHGDDFKHKERNALIQYLHFLDERLANFQKYFHDMKLMGALVDEPIEFKNYSRWKKELQLKLEIEGRLEVNYSYLSDEQRKEFKIESDSSVVQYEEFAQKKEDKQVRRGRPPLSESINKAIQPPMKNFESYDEIQIDSQKQA